MSTKMLITERVVKAKERKISQELHFGVNVLGFVSEEFGIGESARSLVRSLESVDIPVIINEISSGCHRSLDSTFHGMAQSTNPYVVNIIVVNPDSLDTAFLQVGRDYLYGRYNIAYWSWELEKLPNEWFDKLKYFDEVWVPSAFTGRSIAERSQIPVITIPHSIDMDGVYRSVWKWPSVKAGKPFTVFFMLDFRSEIERKNPIAAIRAFREAFKEGDEARFILKIMNGDYNAKEYNTLISECQSNGVEVIDRVLNRQDIIALINECDVYLSLHRAEGFGLTIAEAMAMGKVVIATGYSGNMEFMNVNNSLAVKYKLVDIQEKYGPYCPGNHWAQPDIHHAASLLRMLYENHEVGYMIGQNAVADIARELSPLTIGNAIALRLQPLKHHDVGK